MVHVFVDVLGDPKGYLTKSTSDVVVHIVVELEAVLTGSKTEHHKKRLRLTAARQRKRGLARARQGSSMGMAAT